MEKMEIDRKGEKYLSYIKNFLLLVQGKIQIKKFRIHDTVCDWEIVKSVN